MQSALLEIAQRFRVAIELLLIEGGRFLQHGGGVSWSSTVLIEVSETLGEGQLPGQLDKAQEIATLTTTVTVEEIFVSVDIEGRASFPVQRTEADELVAVSGRPGDPVLLPQIIEQRQALLEFLEILAHGLFLASGGECRGKWPTFPGKDGGWNGFSDAVARESAEPESARTKVQPDDRPNYLATASE